MSAGARRGRGRLHLVAAFVASAVACVSPGRAAAPSEPRALRVPLAAGAHVLVTYDAQDGEAARAVASALPAAAARARRWGPLGAVVVVVHRTSEEFRAAVGESGRTELRAWSRYDEVHLRPPRTWGPLGPSDGELEEVLAHELVHCATYQRVADRDTWTRRPIPFWFREGMAMEVRDPALERAIRGRLRTFEARRTPPPGESALGRAEVLLSAHPDLAYATALVAFDALIERHGERAVGGILDRMRAGAPFAAAFVDATGQPLDAFDADVRRAILAPG